MILKTDKKKESSTLVTKASLDLSDLTLIMRNIGISEGMVAPPPNYETP